MADEVIVEPKPLSQSWTARLNAVVGTLGIFLVIAPQLFADFATLLSGDETRAVLKFMPPKYQDIVDTIVRFLGVAASLVSVVNILIRKYKTVGPITGAAANQLPKA